MPNQPPSPEGSPIIVIQPEPDVAEIHYVQAFVFDTQEEGRVAVEYATSMTVDAFMLIAVNYARSEVNLKPKPLEELVEEIRSSLSLHAETHVNTRTTWRNTVRKLLFGHYTEPEIRRIRIDKEAADGAKSLSELLQSALAIERARREAP